MDYFEKNLRKNISKELDDTLFSELEFGDKQKEEVRIKIISENNVIKSKFFNISFIYRILTPIVIAATLMFVLYPIPKNEVTEEPKLLQKKEMDSEINILNDNQANKTSNLKISDTLPTSFDMKNNEEVREIFGANILLPSINIEGFELLSIQASGESKAKCHIVTYNYTSNGKDYYIQIEKTESFFKPVGYEKIDVNGISALIRNDESISSLEAEIQFHNNGFHYLIGGQISNEEVINLAKGLK
jgi:hypothetical protein